MTTATFIQSVPWDRERAVLAGKLRLQTGAEIVWDEKHSGLETWLKALEAMGDAPAILLEDDVILAKNWREKIEVVIAERPQTLIRFFSNLPDDVTIGSREMPGESFYVNLCVYYPAGYARQIREWVGDRRLAGWQKLHDHVTGEWLKRRGESYWLQVPSLVQHRGDLRSVTAPRRPLNRVSRTFKEDA